MNDEKCESLKLLKLKKKKGGQVIQTFCIIGFSKKLGPPSLNCTGFMNLRNVFLNHAESIDI